jgi:hypothetical protein
MANVMNPFWWWVNAAAGAEPWRYPVSEPPFYVSNVRLESQQARKSFGSSNLPFSAKINKKNQADSACASIASVPAPSRLGAARQVCTSLNPASSRAASQRASDQVVMRVPT